MEQQPLTVRVDGCELVAVPAIHFHHVFAREIYRLCDDPATRPDVVAVEMGPIRTHAIRAWMEELEIGPPSCKPLPVMLGLLSRNRLIRASLSEKAMELQKTTGKDLSELSPAVLKRELGYSGHTLVPLSPTDSIIEAVRCAVELEISAFGVDLDEMPGCRHRPASIQDPLEAHMDLQGYVARNAAWAAYGSDEEIDPRREFVMVARLKGLLRRYGRVLFTGGLSHWARIQKLLLDPSLRPADIPEAHGEHKEVFKRVIVHPLIAIDHMDLFPSLVKEYVDTRGHLDKHSGSPGASSGPLNVLRLFERELEKAYRSYFLGESSMHDRRRKNREVELIRSYEGYLSNLCLLHQHDVPSLFLAIRTAKEMISREFSRALTDSFMEFPWATPQEHPDCGILGPGARLISDPNAGVLLEQKSGNESLIIWDSGPSWGNPRDPKPAYEWQAVESLQNRFRVSRSKHTWLPWDRLVTALCARAMELSASTCRVEVAREFSGSMLGGIHMKETIRSYAKGCDRLYVRDFVKKPCQGKVSIDGFPVVWLIDVQNDAKSDWQVLHVPLMYLEPYLKDRFLFDRVRASRGDSMIAVIAYARRNVDHAAQMEKAEVSTDRHKGALYYLPLPWNNQQFARWAEHTGYSRTPICRDTSLESQGAELRHLFKHRHGIDLEKYHWSTAMIMLAIPYARKVLPVVIPPDFRIERAAHDMAASHRVRLSPVPLKKFDPTEVEKLATCYLVPIITHDPQCIYSEQVEEAIGEKQTANQHMVPKVIREFGLPDF